MLPGIGGSELIVIAIVALIVIGPKDLPKMLRQLGRFVGKMRSMADDFRSAFDDMARQSELDDLRKEVEALRQNQPLDSVGHQMKSIGADIRTGLNAPSPRPDYATPPAETPEAAPDDELDPQLQGLPPKWTPASLANGDAPPAVLPEAATTPPEVVIKKAPRARKAAEATVEPAKKARSRKSEKPNAEKPKREKTAS